MKNKYGYLLVFLCVGALLSCYSRHSSEKENEKKILVNVHFEQEKDLQEEKLPLDVLKPSSMISLDSFLIFKLEDEKDLIAVYDKKQNKQIHSMLQPGNGPEDALFVTPLKYAVSEGGEEKIWIHSFPNYIGLLNLTQSLKQERVIFDQKFSGVGKKDNPIFAANQFIPYEDSVFLVCPDVNRSGPTLSNCNPSIRFYSYKTNSYTDPLYLTDYDLSAQKARTLMSHTLALKPDKQQIAVVFTYLNQLIIVDLATSCKTVITTDPQLPTSEEDTFERHYLWVYATDHSIFAYRIEPNQVTVEVFDWNGNGVYKLHLPHPIINTTLAPAEKAIYGINASDYSVSRFDLSTLFPDKI